VTTRFFTKAVVALIPGIRIRNFVVAHSFSIGKFVCFFCAITFHYLDAADGV
jgi:hypothetical protein